MRGRAVLVSAAVVLVGCDSGGDAPEPAPTPRAVSTATATPTRTPTAAPARAERVRLREYRVFAGARPHDVAPAPDGSVWFTAQGAGELGRLDPRTGKVTARRRSAPARRRTA